jgi:hypothetical protein
VKRTSRVSSSKGTLKRKIGDSDSFRSMEANLIRTNLRGAINWTEKQLSQAAYLDDATMPNGQKYEDWLKDKEGSGKDLENSGPS